jgi:diaminohydroxyphosphoribosylaminopyrimidine deaminase/5-amino-6-(5-phosphoribosylamino)uracil reductase
MHDAPDSQFMKRALELAARGAGHVAPNPMVGCVIVHEGRIIGEGYHQRYGGSHAEVNAIASVEDPALLQESTLYVTLEPCAHFGKTPPCSNLIIEKRIPRVVIGNLDPFPAVNGRGIEQLRNAGIHVDTDVLADECRFMNRRFFTFQEKQRPYVVLKWAQSSDGFMDIERTTGEKGSFMISHPDTQVAVHRWRSEEAAILIGKNTLYNDNPSLTVRRVEGANPLRLLLSSEPIDLSSFHLSKEEAPTWVLTNSSEKTEGAIRYLACGNVHELKAVMRCLFDEKVLSILVEGGAQVLHSFIESGLWDEARVISGVKELGQGLCAPKLPVVQHHSESSAADAIGYYYNKP